MTSWRPGRRDLRRRVAVRDRRDRILVVCAGNSTEMWYLHGVKAYYRAALVDVLDCRTAGVDASPLGVVTLASKRREAYDQVWAVVDVSGWWQLRRRWNLRRAMCRAKRESVGLLVSRPSFDVWPVYHFRDHPSDTTKQGVAANLRFHLARHASDAFPYGEHPQARQRAVRIDPDHNAPCQVGKNLSTNVWLVVDAIRTAGR